jgi:hypothetical protein
MFLYHVIFVSINICGIDCKKNWSTVFNAWPHLTGEPSLDGFLLCYNSTFLHISLERATGLSLLLGF